MTDAAEFPDIRATDYSSFVEGLRRIKEFAQLSDSELEHVAGLTAGHSEKILGPARTRGLGAVTLDALLLTLPLDLQFVFNSKKLARLQKQSTRRKDTHVRRTHPRVSKDGVRRAMRELALKGVAIRGSGSYVKSGQLGGLSRAQSLTPEQRSAAARLAVKARWAKRRAKAAREAKNAPEAA